MAACLAYTASLVESMKQAVAELMILKTLESSRNSMSGLTIGVNHISALLLTTKPINYYSQYIMYQVIHIYSKCVFFTKLTDWKPAC